MFYAFGPSQSHHTKWSMLGKDFFITSSKKCSMLHAMLVLKDINTTTVITQNLEHIYLRLPPEYVAYIYCLQSLT